MSVLFISHFIDDNSVIERENSLQLMRIDKNRRVPMLKNIYRCGEVDRFDTLYIDINSRPIYKYIHSHYESS